MTLRHAPTGFSVAAPSGCRLRVAPPVHRITGGKVGVTVRILRSVQGARAFGEKLKRSGDSVVPRSGGRMRSRMPLLHCDRTHVPQTSPVEPPDGREGVRWLDGDQR